MPVTSTLQLDTTVTYDDSEVVSTTEMSGRIYRASNPIEMEVNETYGVHGQANNQETPTEAQYEETHQFTI